jgi:hypothetical protein
MATVTSNRTTLIVYSGGVVGTEAIAAAQNTNSPGTIQIQNLSSGFNTITAPTGGTVPTSVTIIPPAANATQITLKGVSGDTGILLHLTDHSTISLAAAQATIGLNAASAITGVTFMWT